MSQAFFDLLSQPASAPAQECNAAPMAKLASAHPHEMCLQFRRLPFFLLVFVVGVHPSLLFAQDTANWNGGTGFWSNSVNWACVISGTSKPCVPTGTTVTTVASGLAIMDTNGAVSGLSLQSGGAVTVGAGTRLASGSPIAIGLIGLGTLTVAGGGRASGNRVFAGYFGGSMGNVVVDGGGSQLTSTSDVSVAVGGTAALTITGGGIVSASQGCPTCASAFLGYYAGSNGTVTVSGSGSQWNNSSALLVGIDGIGTLTISNGGVVSDARNCSICSAATLGGNAGASGTATVSDTGSIWNNVGTLNVGVSGNGSLTIKTGGIVNADGLVIGTEQSSVGAVAVDGSGSRLTSSSSVAVGYGGTITGPGGGGAPSGTLTITNGGVVNDAPNCSGCSAAVLGFNTGTTGTVNVSKAGSTWNNTGVVNVGWQGAGTVNVDTNGHVYAQGLIVGSAAGSNGSMLIASGGQVQNAFLSIGDQADSLGSVTVSDAASLLSNSSYLLVGNVGNGTLTINRGATVTDAPNCGTCSAAVVGFSPGVLGRVLVSGAGSKWNSAGVVNLGWQGTGSLNVDTNGQVNAQGLIIGSAAGSSGTVMINAGAVNSTFTSIGDQANSTGTVTVTGAGSQLNSSASLTVGNKGTGSLVIGAGALVASAKVDSTGVVTVTDGSMTVTGAYTQTAGETTHLSAQDAWRHQQLTSAAVRWMAMDPSPAWRRLRPTPPSSRPPVFLTR